MKKSLLLFAGLFIFLSFSLTSTSFAQTDSYSANVIYGNQMNYPIVDLQVDLFDADGNFLGTDITNEAGFFTFNDLTIGDSFTAKFSYDVNYNYVDLEDAYHILLYLFGMEELDGIQLLAADVDASNAVDFTDFWYVLVSYYVNDLDFPAGDWVLPDWQFEMTADKATGGPAHIRRVGDVTNDDQPDKSLDYVQIDYNDIVSFSNNTVAIPIYFNESISTNGVGLVLGYNNELVEVLDIESPIEDLHYNINNGVIKIGWTDIKTSYEFDSETPIVTIHVKENALLSNNQTEQFSILEGTHILNKSGEKYNHLNFTSSQFKLSDASISSGTAYPNPCQEAFAVSISEMNNEIAEVNIYNSLGQLVNQENIRQNGSELLINTQNLENGIYIYQIKINSTLVSGTIAVRK
ncbi:MAG: hypothetical protein B7C24_09375 [Bacteroidetes bacterium 4572_77]|nr:MAG: hypothetical protein B7C24_09375 [Bacteroidetes bacterium 4572_77]